jgi:hypothetical protein
MQALCVERGSKRVMGSNSTEGCDAFAVLLSRAMQDVFEFPHLVAAVQISGQVIQLDREPAVPRGKAQREFANRGGQMRKVFLAEQSADG